MRATSLLHMTVSVALALMDSLFGLQNALLGANGLATSQASGTPATSGALQAAIQQVTGSGQAYGVKPGDAQTKLIGNVNPGDNYPPTNTTLNYTNPGPVSWTTTRPSLTGGLAAGRVSGVWPDGLT